MGQQHLTHRVQLPPLSHAGIQLPDPHGEMRLVFPALMSYVADLMEISDVQCIKCGSGTPHPCEACWVRNLNLDDLGAQRDLRTEEHQARLCRSAAQVARSVAQTLPVHPVPSGLWGFEWGPTDWGSSTRVCHIDGMHSDDIGVFLYIVQSIPLVLTRRLSSARATELCRLFDKQLRELPPAPDSRLPSNTRKLYFSDPRPAEGYQATEHRAVMQVCGVHLYWKYWKKHPLHTPPTTPPPLRSNVQVLPHLLTWKPANPAERALRDDLLKVAATWNISYQHRYRYNRLPEVTEAGLEAIEMSIMRFDAEFKRTIAPYMDGKKGCTVKYHKLAHTRDVLQSLGGLGHASANHYEHAHVVTKAAYAASSRKNATKEREVVQHVRVQAVVQRLQADTRALPKLYNTAFSRAAASSATALPAKHSRAYWQKWSSPDTLSADCVEGALLATQPELKELPAILEARYESPPNAIRIAKGATLAAVVPWLKDCIVCQPVQASTCGGDGKKVWFDSVEVQGEEGEVWYAQLRLLFTDGKDTKTGEQLAMVRWYSVETANGDVLVESGCKALTWETKPGVGGPYYDVIPMNTIIRRVYVVPNSAKGEGHFHQSAFKWDKAPADKKGYEG